MGLILKNSHDQKLMLSMINGTLQGQTSKVFNRLLPTVRHDATLLSFCKSMHRKFFKQASNRLLNVLLLYIFNSYSFCYFLHPSFYHNLTHVCTYIKQTINNKSTNNFPGGSFILKNNHKLVQSPSICRAEAQGSQAREVVFTSCPFSNEWIQK